MTAIVAVIVLLALGRFTLMATVRLRLTPCRGSLLLRCAGLLRSLVLRGGTILVGAARLLGLPTALRRFTGWLGPLVLRCRAGFVGATPLSGILAMLR